MVADNETSVVRLIDCPRCRKSTGMVRHGHGNLPSGHRSTTSTITTATINIAVAPAQKLRSTDMAPRAQHLLEGFKKLSKFLSCYEHGDRENGRNGHGGYDDREQDPIDHAGRYPSTVQRRKRRSAITGGSTAGRAARRQERRGSPVPKRTRKVAIYRALPARHALELQVVWRAIVLGAPSLK